MSSMFWHFCCVGSRMVSNSIRTGLIFSYSGRQLLSAGKKPTTNTKLETSWKPSLVTHLVWEKSAAQKMLPFSCQISVKYASGSGNRIMRWHLLWLQHALASQDYLASSSLEPAELLNSWGRDIWLWSLQKVSVKMPPASKYLRSSPVCRQNPLGRGCTPMVGQKCCFAFPTCICWMLCSACLVWIWIVCFVSQLERRQAYLKKALTSNRISFILLQGTFFRREMTHVKQSVRIYNEFMVFCSCAMLCLR